MSNVVNKRRGRPRGKSQACEDIINAARKSFTEQGYKATTLREIAQNAGVDHSLVNYYFGSKENLFNESLLDGFSPAAVFKRVRDTPGITVSNLPRLLSHAFVAFCESPPFQRTVTSTLRLAFEDQETQTLVTDYVEHEIFHEAEKLLQELRSQSPRALSASSHEVVIGMSTVLLGALTSRYILQSRPHAELSPHEFRVCVERLLRGALT